MPDRDDAISLPTGRFLWVKRQETGLEIAQVAERTGAFLRPMRVSPNCLAAIEVENRMPSLFQLLALTLLYRIALRDFMHILGNRLGFGRDTAFVPAAPTLFVDAADRPVVADCIEGNVSSDLEAVRNAFSQAMKDVSERCQAEAAAVVLGPCDWVFSVGLTDDERGALEAGEISGPWHEIQESEDGFRLRLYLKSAQLSPRQRRLAEVAVVRWWAGLKVLHRRAAQG